MATDVCSETEMIALLQRAFPLAPLDAETVVGGSHTSTYFSGNDEAKYVKQLVEGKNWLSLDVASLDRHSDILFFLQPGQFAALLPAFLHVAVTRFDQFVPLVELLLSLLTRDSKKPANFDRRISALSRMQQSAVAAVMRCLVTLCEAWPNNPASTAYESYWRTLVNEETNE